MLTTVELLTKAKKADEERGGTGSDYATAKRLGWSPQMFNAIMLGVRRASDQHVTEAATLAGIDPSYALACIHAEQSEGSVTHHAWMRVAKVLEAAERAA